MTRVCLARPHVDAKTTDGRSPPAIPAFITPVPLSITTGCDKSADAITRFSKWERANVHWHW